MSFVRIDMSETFYWALHFLSLDLSLTDHIKVRILNNLFDFSTYKSEYESYTDRWGVEELGLNIGLKFSPTFSLYIML